MFSSILAILDENIFRYTVQAMITMKAKDCKHGDGFSLIELLVAIAVVAILSLISIAIIPQALERGKQAKCASNLRMLGTAFFSYLMDNDQIFPVAYKASGGWPKELVDGEYASEGSFCCPSNNENPNDYKGTNSHYGYNQAHIATRIRQTNDITNNSVAISYYEIVSPARTVLLVENLRPNRTRSSYLVWDSYTSGNPEKGNPEPRHNGSFNVLWCDGHVSAVSAASPEDAYSPHALGEYKNSTSKWKIE